MAMSVRQKNIAAYFLWKAGMKGGEKAHWYCAESIRKFCEKNGYKDEMKILRQQNLPQFQAEYLKLLQELAQRIYIFSGNENAAENWEVARRALSEYMFLDVIMP